MTKRFLSSEGRVSIESLFLWRIRFITEIDGSVEGGDVYFPKLDLHEWETEIKEKYLPDLKNKFGMTFKVLHRKKISC